MSQHPLNLALRFVLELTALAALAVWGGSVGQGGMGVLLAVLAPALAAFAWAVFRAPGDPPHAAHPRVRVPGPLRLLLEAVLFGLAVGAFASVGATAWAVTLAVVVVVHYVLSYDRVRALLGLS